MKSFEKVLLVGTFLAGSCAVAVADETVGQPAAPVTENAAAPEASAPEKSDFNFTAYVDVSAFSLSDTGLFTSGVPTRVFDRQRGNAFDLQTVDLTASFLPKEGFGGLVNLNFGRDADVIGPFRTSLTDKFDVQAAYAQYATGPFTVLAGKFVTLSGAEVIKSTADTNFSRSILFGYAIPFTHTGARVVYAFNDKTTFTVGVNRGWDVALDDNNNDETLELGASFVPIDPLAVLVSFYSGKELGSTGINGSRNLIDLVGTYTVNDALSLVLNFDYAHQTDAIGPGSDATWDGVAGYVNYKLNDKWHVSLRGEYFDDSDGFRTGVTQQWKEATATLAYLPFDFLELRAEVRGDWSNVNSFLKNDGGTKDNESSVGIEALFKYGS